MRGKCSSFWDQKCAAHGHTGYADTRLHRYDQPVRLATVREIVEGLFPENGLEGRAALDIGCGTGDFIELLLEYGALVTGIDISPLAVEGAADRFKHDKRVRVLCGSVAELVVESEAYEVITSVTVLQHIVNDEEFLDALRRLRRALKEHGKLIILELAPPGTAAVQRRAGGVNYLTERPPQAWRDAFSEAGLAIVDEPVMPQLGVAAVRSINQLIDRFRSSRIAGRSPRVPVEAHATPASARPLLRKGLHTVHELTLTASWLFDHLLRAPLPPDRFRHYRVFILNRQI